MKKLNLLILLLIAWPIGMLAEVSRDSLPSNYGNWVNLTEGYTQDHSYDHQKMQVEMDGNTIHLLWAEFAKQSDGTYGLWYRRSTDLGKTWEDARLVVKTRTNQFMNINSGANNKLMAISNGHVHIAVMDCDDNEPDAKWRILYVRSDDGGANFTTKTMGILSSRYESYRGIQIDSDGDMVVIAAPKYGNDIVYFTSKDSGDNFSTQTQTIDPSGNTPGFFDMQVKDGHWVSMTFGTYWYSNLKYGYLFITTSDGTTMSTKQVAPLHSDGVPYANPNVMRGANGNSYNYHPQMAIVGNTIHLMYQGNPGGKESKDDYNHTLYQKSEDFGETWSNVVDLPESDGGDGMIVAKGQNVYILTTKSGYHAIYYSNDGGSTWNYQTQALVDNKTFRSYWLTIDPYDASGNHAYLTANRYYYAETKDGFKTLSKNFVLGSEAFIGTNYGNNHALVVLPDQNGTEHWFLQYNMPVQVTSGTGYYVDWENNSRDICYLRVEAEPAPSGTKALNLTDKDMLDYRVVIPMSPSLMQKEAMTVEAWVRLDSVCSFQIAGTSMENTHNTSHYNGGWYMKADHWYGNGGYFEGGLRTDKATDDVGVRLYNEDALRIYKMKKWHHVALTYDAEGGENNARFYIDGMLVASKTVVGGIQMGKNPIAIGATAGYGSKGLLDHFAMFNRALTVEELREHMYQMPTGKENGCVCLLNFDGTLKDMSGNGNDGVALLDVDFVEHDGIRVPTTNINVAKDITGRYVTVSNASPNAEVDWWRIPYKWKPGTYTSETKPSVKIDFSPSGDNNFAGTYTTWMVAAGTGDYNAYTTASEQFTIGGLNKVEPIVSGQEAGVRLTIQGGYTLTESKQPKVLLHKDGAVIEGKWMVEKGYDSSKIESADDLAKALFNLSNADPGIYDVVVDNDTLYSAFTIEKSEEPDVWMQVNGWDRQLRNKWKDFTIDYGNRSNAAAYNVPIILMVSNNKGLVDVSFDFDFELCNTALDDYGQSIAKKVGDHVMAYDQTKGDSVQVYSFMIPYIAPNSTGHKTFRMRHRFEGTDGGGSEEVDMIYWAEKPWGPYDPDAPNPYGQSSTRGTRAPYTLEQGECVAKELGTALAETAIGFIPGVGCMYSMGKTVYQSATEVEKPWSTFFSNYVSTFFSCCEDLIPAVKLAQAAFTLGSMAWTFYSAGSSMKGCLNGDPKDKKVKGVNSYDPNEMIGPSGYDDNAHYIKPINNMAYTITYENKSTASAPAHEVYVNDKLDLSKFDPESFGFTSFGWADTTIVVGGSYTKDFTRDIKYRVKDQDIIVRVSGKFDTETGEANWSMISLTTSGNEIDDPDLGYLLPNNDSHAGEGFVTFSINHKANPATGSTISNKAVIVFDANPPIETNVFTNTFDTDYPTSKITKSEVSGSNLILTLEGKDATSGVASYDIYVFKNGGEAESLAYGVTENQYTLPYVEGTKYSFCTIATDHVGWKEAKDIKAEYTHSEGTAPISIGKSGKASYCGDKSLDFSFSDEIKAYIATGFDKDEGTIWLTRVKDVPAGVPVLIKGEANKTYDVPLTDSQNSYYKNMFVGNTSGGTVQITETEGDFVNYYLSGDGTFKSVNKSANIGNNKSYLQLPGTFKPAVAGATQKVTIKDIGKASYAAPVDLDFTNVEGLKAFTATGYDKSTKTIWLTRVMKVQKGEGVLLKGDAKDYEIPSAAVQSSYMNMFVGNTSGASVQVQEKSEDGSQTNYYLKGDGSFVSVNGFVNIGNNKCYLELPTSMVAVASTRGAEANYLMDEPEIIKMSVFRSIGNDGDGTTGIKDQSSKFNAPSDAYYTLQGQRVVNPGKGLYIKNGKKVVIK